MNNDLLLSKVIAVVPVIPRVFWILIDLPTYQTFSNVGLFFIKLGEFIVLSCCELNFHLLYY